MNSNNIILKDVAKRAGVSISTASRVLNNEKFVSPEVRKRVNNAANELKYEPMWTARSLRLRKTNIIAVIIPNIADYFYSSIVLGIERFFRQNKKDVILFNTSNDEKSEERSIRVAISKRVEGIILATIFKNKGIINSIIENTDIPFVLVDNKLEIKNIDYVLADDIKGSYKLVEHLIKVHGFKRIGILNASLIESSDRSKLIGYKKALTKNNIDIDENYIKIINYPKKGSAYIAAEELLNMEYKPEAIYCINLNILIGCLKYLNDKNLKVPDDVAIISFDDSYFLSAINPSITSLKRIDVVMGNKAAEILLERINNKNSNYKKIILPSTLIVRKSCGCT